MDRRLLQRSNARPNHNVSASMRKCTPLGTISHYLRTLFRIEGASAVVAGASNYGLCLDLLAYLDGTVLRT